MFLTQKRCLSGGGNGSKIEGNLTLTFIKDANDRVHHACYYEYDDNGNVLAKTFIGKLTSSQAPQVYADDNYLHENGYEREKKIYKYSKDGSNLLIGEKDSIGNNFIYTYYPDTDLIRSKILKYQKRAIKREFYTYNEDSVLIKKVVDDGAGEDENDLKGVTERHLTYITPQKIIPIGLPETVVEKYLDLATGTEIQLQKIVCEYSKEGNLTAKTTFDANDQYAFVETWEYDSYGNIKKETNALGETIKRKYDNNNNLIRQEHPGSDFYITNEYDFSNRLIKQEEIHQDGQTFTTKYTYNHLSQKVSSTDTYGNETFYTYDEFGRLISTTLPEVFNENGVSAKPAIKSEYDIAGYPTTMTDPLGRTIQMENNAKGKPLHISYPDGTEEWITYRVDGQLTSKVNRDGSKTEYTLDSIGRIINERVIGNDGKQTKAITRSYNAFHLITETDPEGLIVRYHYDGAGRLSEVFKNDILFQEYSYDTLGRISQIRDWYNKDECRITTKNYDFLNRVKSEMISSADGTLLHVESYDYDYLGNKTKVQVGDQITQTFYNSQNNPVKIIDALGNETHIEYDTAFLNEYHQLVLQTTTTDPLGNQTTHTYDTANQLVQTTRKNPLGIVVANQKKFYDLCGNCTSVVDDVIYQGETEKSIRTLYEYTTDKQVKLILEAAGTPEQKLTSYQYNGVGQKIAKVKPDGILILYEYDGLGRVSKMSSSDNTICYLYNYNGRDQIVSIADERTQSETYYRYNQLGQLEFEKLGNGLMASYTHDWLDRLTGMILPDGSAVGFAFNAQSLKSIHRIKGGISYDHVNNDHNLAGQITRATLPGLTGTIDYQYDKMNRCIAIQSKHFSQTIPQNGFDAAGNLVKFKTGEQDYDFKYDHLYQLCGEEGHASHNYAYDSLNNRRLKDHVKHEINSLNQLTSRGKEVYNYDLNGNLVHKITGDQVTKYSFDALDRLIGLDINGIKTTYTYDANGRRLSKRPEGQSETLFFYQGDEEIGSWKDGSFSELKILNQSCRSSVAVELGNAVYVPTQDIFANVVNLSDLYGNMVESYRYSAFGEAESFDSKGERQQASANPWQYSNKRLDPESGLVAFGLRYYDPDLGRWINPDPSGFEDGPNLYAYVHNNPLRYCDLLGLFTELPAFGAIKHVEMENTLFNFKKESMHSLDLDPWNRIDFFSEAPISWGTPSASYQLNDFTNPATGFKFNYPMDPLRGVSFINGIRNDSTSFQNGLMYFGNLLGRNISGVHNTSLGLGGDLVRHYQSHCNMKAYEPVRLLHSQWREFFDNAPPGALFLQIGHSDGCTNLRNALIDFPPELRNRIVVLAIAPGSFIDRGLCKDVLHLCSHWDPVPKSDPKGFQRCKDTVVFVDSPIPVTNATSALVAPIYGSLSCHGLDSSIYKKRICEFCDNYFNGGY